MFKVLLVDDERIIREGISKIIDWEKHNFSLMGTAKNGVEAYEMICNDQPHIVITDIKMPVLDGLQLIAKVKGEFPDTEFIVLSGYGEFELANEAMKYGIRHYLLKPCNEEKIINVLLDLRKSLEKKEKREEFIKKNKEDLDRILPLVKEQFVRDFIMNRTYTKDEFQYYRKLLSIEDSMIRLVLFEPYGEYDFEDIMALLNIISKVIEEEIIYYKTVVKNHALVIVKYLREQEIEDMLNQIIDEYHDYSHEEVTIAYSKEGTFEELPVLFQKAQEYLRYSFYLGEGSIISNRDIGDEQNTNDDNISLENKEIIIAVKSGNQKAFIKEIERYFNDLCTTKCDTNTFKYHCLELSLAILRQCNVEMSQEYIQEILSIQMKDSLEQIKESIVKIGTSLTNMNYNGITVRHNKIVRKMIEEVEKKIDDENLSLKWLANEVLYMNVGYLSKLFLKETGEKFSHYLMRQRMEKAKELIASMEDDKIYEIAGKIGMGENPQYFSQLFKKYTGMTPSEYKRIKK